MPGSPALSWRNAPKLDDVKLRTVKKLLVMNIFNRNLNAVKSYVSSGSTVQHTHLYTGQGTDFSQVQQLVAKMLQPIQLSARIIYDAVSILRMMSKAYGRAYVTYYILQDTSDQVAPLTVRYVRINVLIQLTLDQLSDQALKKHDTRQALVATSPLVGLHM